MRKFKLFVLWSYKSCFFAFWVNVRYFYF